MRSLLYISDLLGGFIGATVVFGAILLLSKKKIHPKIILFMPIVVFVLFATMFSIMPIQAFDEGNFGILSIIAFSIMATIFFLMFMFEKIAENTRSNESSGYVLLRIGLAALAGIVYFSCVYTVLYRIHPDTFIGLNLGNADELIKQYLNFLYFSIVSFSTVGYGDIQAVRLSARMIVSMELIFSFITIVYVISSFSNISDTFRKSSPFSLDNKGKKM